MGQLVTVAGFDPTGGAGILRDLQTFSQLGCSARAIISAVTAQNLKGEVSGFNAVSSDILIKQLDSIESDENITHIKVGMLGSKENIISLSLWIKAHLNKIKIVVLDPILCSSRGYFLTDDWELLCLKENLFPYCTLVTPNIYEAEVLSKKVIKSPDDMINAGRVILNEGCNAVLVKGGHLGGNAVDILITKTKIHKFYGKKIDKTLHGTGCILSSAITSFLYLNYSLIDACKKGKNFVEKKLKE